MMCTIKTGFALAGPAGTHCDARKVLGDNAGVMTDALAWAGTFHGIGARLLRDYSDRIGLDPAFSRVRMTSLGSALIDETADQPGKRLMLRAGFALSEKVSEFDSGRRSARRHVGLVQDENTSIFVATEQPSVAVLAMVNFALVIGHLGLRGNNPPRAGFVPPADASAGRGVRPSGN